MLVISLTSIPSRFARLPQRLRSLMAQQVPDLRVELYIPRRYRRFPEHDGSLPEVPPGVALHVVEDDLGPASKVLFAARRHRGQDVDILYCDDDVDYLPDWAPRLLTARKRLPRAAIAARTRMLEGMGVAARADRPQPHARLRKRALDFRYAGGMLVQALRHGGRSRIPPEQRPARDWLSRSGYADVAEGIGGVLIRPDFLDDAAFDPPPEFFAVDDIWLSGHLARRGIPIWGEQGASRFRLMDEHRDADPLWNATIAGVGRLQADRACIAHFRETYGVWPAA